MATGSARRCGPIWRLGSPVVLFAVAWLAGLRLNLTSSLPAGLYLASGAAAARGALILVCLPPRVARFAKERGYVPRGGTCPGGIVPVGKPVLAMAGDRSEEHTSELQSLTNLVCRL